MKVESLLIQNFRNLDEVWLEPSQTFNILAGANAQGKTSILEAIHLVSTGRVLRGSKDSNAIQHEKDASIVKAVLTSSKTELLVELAHGKRKRTSINGLGLRRASDLMGRLPSVCFWAGDLAISQGEPAARRLFLDAELSQVYPGYLQSFALYKRALEQRNSLLKKSREGDRVDPDEFDAWEVHLATAGTDIRQYRQEYVAELSVISRQQHQAIAPAENFELSIDLADETDLATSLREFRVSDIRRGSTSVGPHRDDLVLCVNGMNVRQFGSQGQQRSVVISLKLGVLELARQKFGFPPLLLLDDIFSDLDASRRVQLVETASHLGGQVFLTCTEAEQAGEKLRAESRIYSVASGRIVEG